MIKLKRAFVVDTDPAYESTIQWQLRQSGFEVASVSSCNGLNENLSGGNLIVLDHYLKGCITGVESLRQIKSQHRDIPVLFLLNPIDMHTAAQTLFAGAFYYVEKGHSFLKQFKYAIDQ